MKKRTKTERNNFYWLVWHLQSFEIAKKRLESANTVVFDDRRAFAITGVNCMQFILKKSIKMSCRGKLNMSVRFADGDRWRSRGYRSGHGLARRSPNAITSRELVWLCQTVPGFGWTLHFLLFVTLVPCSRCRMPAFRSVTDRYPEDCGREAFCRRETCLEDLRCECVGSTEEQLAIKYTHFQVGLDTLKIWFSVGERGNVGGQLKSVKKRLNKVVYAAVVSGIVLPRGRNENWEYDNALFWQIDFFLSFVNVRKIFSFSNDL